MKTKQLVQSAVLVSTALALSYLEHFFPLQLLIPLPGIKLGLANLVTMFALYFMTPKQCFLILMTRCILGSMFGGLSGLAMSISGGVFAFIVMLQAGKTRVLSVFGVSILGAAAHNLGQVLAAAIMMGTVFTFYYLPVLLIVSIVTGFLTGAVSSFTFGAIYKLQKKKDDQSPAYQYGEWL